MITHKDAAEAQVRAQQLVDEAELARARARRAPGSPFKNAYAEAKGREAQAAVTRAVAMAHWAAWGVAQAPLAMRAEAAE